MIKRPDVGAWGRERGAGIRPRWQRGLIGHQPAIYGRSMLGAPLQAYLPAQWSRHRTLVVAGIHGEEAETTNVLSYGLRSLQPAALHCAIVLCANPDGMAAATRGNAQGVDLNRNFPAANWQPGSTPNRAGNLICLGTWHFLAASKPLPNRKSAH